MKRKQPLVVDFTFHDDNRQATTSTDASINTKKKNYEISHLNIFDTCPLDFEDSTTFTLRVK